MSGHTRSFSSKQVLLTATAQEIVGPSERRSGLIIMPPLNGSAFIGTDNTITIGSGISLHHDSGPLSLFREQVGDLVRRGLWAVGLAAYGVNRDFALQQVRATSSGAGLRTATIAGVAGYHFEIDGIAVSADKNEYGTFALNDSAPTTYLNQGYYGWHIQQFNPPLRSALGANVSLAAAQTATSTAVNVTVWGRQVLGASGLSESLRMSVIEIFDCDCQQSDAPSIINYIDRRK